MEGFVQTRHDAAITAKH